MMVQEVVHSLPFGTRPASKIQHLQSQGVPVPGNGNGKNAVVWSSADKFGVVLENGTHE